MTLRIRETVFEHEEGRDKVTITAAEAWSINRLRKLAAEYPEEVDIYENKDGSLFGHVPAEWMKLVPPPKHTPEQKAAMAERAKKLAEIRRSMK